MVLKERYFAELGKGQDELHEYHLLRRINHPNVIEVFLIRKSVYLGT